MPEGGAEGVIVANADFIGGFSLWVDEQGRLNHTYSFLGVEEYKQTSDDAAPDGRREREDAVRGRRDRSPAAAAAVTLWANGEQIGEGRLDKTVPMLPSSYAGMDVSRDNGLVVDLAYEDKAPYVFTGHGEEGRVRPPARRPRTTTTRRCTSTRASTRWRTGSARRGQTDSRAGATVAPARQSSRYREV